MAHFYWDVSSDETEQFPENKLHAFSNRLYETQNLDENWEVGVHSALFHNAFSPFGSVNSSVISTDSDHTQTIHDFRDNTIRNRLDNFNTWANKNIIDNPPDALVITRSENEGGKLVLTWTGPGGITFRGKICHAMGFSANEIILSDGESAMADFPWVPPLLRHIYVYSDIVKPSLVGDFRVPLIMHTDLLNDTTFSPPVIQFKSVSGASIMDANFTIFDGVGYPVQFINRDGIRGSNILTLIFKRKQPVLF